MSPTVKATTFSAVQVAAAVAVYAHLITGGWLTTRYRWDDPNVVNLLLALFEPFAILGALAYWVWRTPSLYRLLSLLFLAQVLIALGFLLFFLIFILLWHPRLM